MLKVEFFRARVSVRGEFLTTGSVLAGTIESVATRVTTDLEVESDAPREQVLRVLRQAENGCYAMQALRRPVPVETTMTLNGEPVSLD